MRKKKSSKMKKRKKTPIIFLCNPQEQTFTLKHTILSLVMSHVTRISYVICHMSILPYVTHMYSYVIRVSLVCTRMPSACHSYVLRMSLICTRMYSYVTHMYSYVIRMSLACGFTMNPILLSFCRKFAPKI